MPYKPPRPPDRLPDEEIALSFRHFLERYKLGEVTFDTVNTYLKQHSLLIREDTVEVAITSAFTTTTMDFSGNLKII